MRSSHQIVSAEESRPFEECCQTCRQPWLMWFTITQMPPLHITAGCILDPDTPNSLNHELEQMCAPVQNGFKRIGKVYRINPYCYCLLHWIQIQNFHYSYISFPPHPHTQAGLKHKKKYRKAGKTIIFVIEQNRYNGSQPTYSEKVAWRQSRGRTQCSEVRFNVAFISFSWVSS